MGRKGAGGLRHRVEGERRGRRDRCVLEGEDARRGIGGEGHWTHGIQEFSLFKFLLELICFTVQSFIGG